MTPSAATFGRALLCQTKCISLVQSEFAYRFETPPLPRSWRNTPSAPKIAAATERQLGAFGPMVPIFPVGFRHPLSQGRSPLRGAYNVRSSRRLHQPRPKRTATATAKNGRKAAAVIPGRTSTPRQPKSSGNTANDIE